MTLTKIRYTAFAAALALAAAGVGASVPRSPDPALTLTYGQDPRQVVLVYTAGPRAAPAATDTAARPPLAVYVHGGAWRAGSPMRVRAKPQWFREAGWAFASVGYRLLPDATVEEQHCWQAPGPALRLVLSH